MTRTYLELFFATMIWGFAFPATVWTLRSIGPVLTTAVRFTVAVIFLDLIFRFKLIKNTKAIKYRFKEFLVIFQPGLYLFGMLTLQTWGLKYTSPTRSGFITVFYVMMVPFLENFFKGTRFRILVAVWILTALLGTALICEVVTVTGINHNFLGAINLGDVLTFFCAICAAAHIMVVDQILPKVESPLKFHIYQCMWIALFAGVVSCFTEGFGALSHLSEWPALTWVGMFHLSILSSGIAFLIQIRSQRTIPPTQLSLLVLLESPWALIFSVWLGMEMLTGLQLTGAALILAAAISESVTAARLAR